MSDGVRRHVPGLRREEVAARAGISTTWYTWIEQGRDINKSLEVVEAIGRGLNLQPHEMAYIRNLADDDAAARYEPNPAVPEALRALVESHREAPAYIATPRFDLLVWNEFMHSIFRYERDSDEFSRNILWRMFFDPSRRETYVDWERAARGGVAAFRTSYARYCGHPAFDTLLAGLKKSRDFLRIWNRWEIAELGMPPFLVRTPELGVLEISTIQATLDIAPGCYLALFHCTKVD